jgi:FlaA1/EpsC-like NDP-sugar epimerase
VIDISSIIGRDQQLFSSDLEEIEPQLTYCVSESSFLVLGAAGSIGSAVVREIFIRNPRKLHVVDISENNLVELVRDLRSSSGYIKGEFKTFALDIGSKEYDAFYKAGGRYDFVLNLSALKHVRSEEDEFTLMRMINTNIFNTLKTINQSIESGVKKYFCVSTDKASNPVNMMGASKRIMEMFLMQASSDISVSTARFANVAFSDGSLLYGLTKRLEKCQPIAAPHDVRRYFLTPQESGELCLIACLFGDNRDIFFPKLSEELDLISISEIATRFLKQKGYDAYLCTSENEARELVHVLPAKGKWPCYFSSSDTTGEKATEEFFTESEELDMLRFQSLGIIKQQLISNEDVLLNFEKSISALKADLKWKKQDLISLFERTIESFNHSSTGKFLDGKM